MKAIKEKVKAKYPDLDKNSRKNPSNGAYLVQHSHDCYVEKSFFLDGRTACHPSALRTAVVDRNLRFHQTWGNILTHQDAGFYTPECFRRQGGEQRQWLQRRL